jgi:RNA polymerase sigma factor (sigma-70 family)
MDTATLESDVTLAGNGDEAAFGRLVDRSANTVCSIALAIVRNVEASEDIAQEAFIAAWKNLRNLRNPASFLPWLRQVTRNQAHLWQREHRREITDEDVVMAAADARPSAADQLLADEERRLVTEVLDRLPDEAREVLILYYREESSSRHVAQLLGISDDAVRQRLSRGRALLREEMLQRFGHTVARTAPGAAFAGAVAGALTFTAPTASAAAIAMTAGRITAAGIAKVTAIGGVFGWFGVLMGMRYLQPYFDDEEARSLRRFRNTVLAVVTLGGLGIALNSSTPWRIVISVQSVYCAIGGLYAFWLPRILDRMMKDQQSIDPELAKKNRRQWMWATIGRAVGAANGGAGKMAANLAVSSK